MSEVTNNDWIAKKRGELPQNYKLIECYGYDWSPFYITGAFIPYKGLVKKGKPKSRFCVLDENGAIQTRNGNYSPDKETWENVDKYRYLDQEQEAKCQ